MEITDRLVKIDLLPAQPAFQSTYLKKEFHESLVKWAI